MTMTQVEWESVLAAYRRGLAADMIQFKGFGEDEWGVIWTIPPCSPAALEHVARQAVRCCAVRVRHVRRAKLTAHSSQEVRVIIVTEAVPVVQIVRCLSSGRLLKIEDLLIDDALETFLTNFSERTLFTRRDTV